MEKNSRTLWVGNLHPKVTCDLVAELFYQVGPIENIKFAIDEHELSENFAWIIFKHSSSVDDSIKLLNDTKLYGLPITTRHYSKHLEVPVFHDQLDYFKQLVNVEYKSQSNDNSKKRIWIDRSSESINNIPDSLPQPSLYNVSNIYSNQDDHDYKLNDKSRHTYIDKPSKYQHNKPYAKSNNFVGKNELNSIEKSYYSSVRHQKSDLKSSRSGSIEGSNFGHNSYQNYDRKHRDADTSSNWQGNTYHNQETSFKNNNNSAKVLLPVRDLRDTLRRKKEGSNYDYHSNSNSNAACTSLFDLRDTMYHSKKNRYEDPGQFKSDNNNQWSEKHRKNFNSSSFTDKDTRKNNFSDRHNDFNLRHKNREFIDQSFYEDKSYENVQEYNNPYPNNYNDNYRREKDKPKNYNFTHTRSQNMETSNRQNNFNHSYKRNDEGFKRKKYRNSYDGRNGDNHGRSYNKK